MLRRFVKLIVPLLNPKPTLIDSILCNRDEDIKFAILRRVNLNYCNIYNQRSFIYGLLTAIYFEKYSVAKLMLESDACPNFPYSQSSLYHHFLLFDDPKKLVTNYNFGDVRKLDFEHFRMITSTVVAFLIGNPDLLEMCLEYGGELSNYFTGFVATKSTRNGEDHIYDKGEKSNELPSLSFLGYFLTVYRPQNENSYVDIAKVLIEFQQFQMCDQERNDFSRMFHSYYINANSRSREARQTHEKSSINLDKELTFRLLIDYGFSIYVFSDSFDTPPLLLNQSTDFWVYDDEDEGEEDDVTTTDDQLEDAFRKFQCIEYQRRHSDASLHLQSKSYDEFLSQSREYDEEEEEVDKQQQQKNDEDEDDDDFFNKHEQFTRSRKSLTRRNSTGSLDFPISGCFFSPTKMREAERFQQQQEEEEEEEPQQQPQQNLLSMSLHNLRSTTTGRKSKRRRRWRRSRRRRRKSVSLLKEVLIRRTRRSMSLASSSNFFRSLTTSSSSNTNNHNVNNDSSNSTIPSTPMKNKNARRIRRCLPQQQQQQLLRKERGRSKRSNPKELPIRWEQNKDHKPGSPRTPVPIFGENNINFVNNSNNNNSSPFFSPPATNSTGSSEEENLGGVVVCGSSSSGGEDSDASDSGVKKRRCSIVANNDSFYLRSITRRRKISDRYKKRKRSSPPRYKVLNHQNIISINNNSINNNRKAENDSMMISSSTTEEDSEEGKRSRRVKRNRGSPGEGDDDVNSALKLSISSTSESSSSSCSD